MASEKDSTRRTARLRLRAVVMGFLIIAASPSFLCAASGTAGNSSAFESSAAREVNHLATEKSPYLLEHANDLVNWYPWGTAAFARAQQENKLIFLSVGFSSCHWCHVMQREDFQDPEVADLMNRSFVSILVDREQRPDIDHQYMAACMAMTGSGGWPLNVIMTPFRNPFFAAVYVPKRSNGGVTGMLELIPRVEQKWESDPKGVLKDAGKIRAQIALGLGRNAPGNDLEESSLKRAYQQLAATFDPHSGGFGGPPNFPPFLDINFLLHYWKRTADPKALDMVEVTLDRLRAGAIFDQVGFGFHRFTLDAEWRAPHFEKMLYDQAQAATAYVEAYQATKKTRFAQTARNIFDYVASNLTSPQGAFYDAEDADSEGVEGKFYLWTEQQIRAALNDANAGLVMRAFGVTARGNFASGGKGENTLYLRAPINRLAADWQIREATLQAQWESARIALLAARTKRVHPSRDEKVTSAWNGLMIAAYAKGAQALGDKRYAETAQQAADFILKNLAGSQGGHSSRLLHSYFDKEASVAANLDDYAYLVQALLDLYETGFQIRNLQAAIDLNHELFLNFWDATHAGFFYTPNGEQGSVLAREKSFEDSDLPSGNSVAALNLLRLANMTGNPELEQKALELERVISGAVERSPADYPAMLLAADFKLGPSFEVVIAGNPQAADTQSLLRALSSTFVPNKVVLLRPTSEPSPEILRIAEYTRYQTSVDGRATAYVCLRYNCKLPVTDAGKMLESLNVKTTNGGGNSP
jgi:uncharacterized protein YyaL (SSP411 family)